MRVSESTLSVKGGDVTIARKSRKIEKEEAVGTSIINNAGLYARLSIEDSGKRDGNSIKNQIEILNSFVNAKVGLTYGELYCDNGETGTNFERPEWERLMQDIKKGKINCIVVKDLSRLGRNYIEVGNYIESIFPFLKVRFIAIYDHYDSQKEYFKECDMEASLKNLVNDFYSKDISKKVLSSLNSKKKKGDFIGSITPYGYKRSEENKNKLAVDKVTAPIVKKIFRWKLNGLSDNEISKILNEEGVWSPNRYRYELGLRKGKKYESFLWQAQTIHLITDNLVYLGHMAQGKYNASIYKVGSKQRIPEADWVVVKNTHEGIIEEDTYNKILELRNIKRKRFKEQQENNLHLVHMDNVLRGIMFCGECKHPIQRKQDIVNKERIDYYYYCASRRKYRNVTCNGSLISEKKVLNLVCQLLQIQITLTVEETDRRNLLCKREAFVNEEYERKVANKELHKKIRRMYDHKKSLHEELKDKLLSEEEYLYAKKKIDKELEFLYNQVKSQEELKNECEGIGIEKDEKKSLSPLEFTSGSKSQTGGLKNQKLKWLDQFMSEKELTKEIAISLLEVVEIYQNKQLHIRCSFKDEFEGFI